MEFVAKCLERLARRLLSNRIVDAYTASNKEVCASNLLDLEEIVTKRISDEMTDDDRSHSMQDVRLLLATRPHDFAFLLKVAVNAALMPFRFCKRLP